MTAPPTDDEARRWRRVEEICDAALTLGQPGRDAYLASACGADQALRREVEALLVHEKTSQEFLSAPIGAVAAQVLEPPRNLIGTRIADYEVVAKLGEGGMGEVYRARDRKLGRDVAIKVLPAAVANDPERLKRFEREARLLASVNHPSIGAIYGVAEADSLRALVLELIEGETLAAVLERGPIKLDRALAIAAQICDALDHAHRRGVTHRDLKPSNVMLVEGRVKVLDFGVGKSASPVSGAAVSRESTLTNDGAIVGTLHYMSPEQLEGRATDARSDIFSFGAVLYEMLSGRKAFDGPSQASIIAAVMEAPTPKLTGIASPLAPRLERVVAKCLAKSPDDRWQGARDLADELRWLGTETGVAPATNVATTRVAPWARRPIGTAFASAAALVTLALIGFTANNWRARGGITPAATIRFSVTPQTADVLGDSFDISNDGSQLVYYDQAPSSVGRLHLRRLDRFDTMALPGSDDSWGAAFSPDGQWVAFGQDRVLRKIKLNGEAAPVVVLDDVGPSFEINWSAADAIFLTARNQPIRKVSANGGVAEAVTTIQPATEVDHHGPELLPSGKALLFAVHGKRNRFSIAVQDLVSGTRKTLIESGFAPLYSPSGHLLFGRGSTLMAVPFDGERLELRGDPVVLVEQVSGDPRSGRIDFRLSANGTLVYVPARRIEGRQLVWLDRTGRETATDIPPQAFDNPRVSPDGKQLAFVAGDSTRRDIWIHQIDSGRLARLTENGDNWFPQWLPDGDGLLYSRDDGAASLVVRHRFNGAGLETLGSSSDDNLLPTAIDTSGRVVLIQQPPTDNSHLALLVPGSRSPQPLLKNSGNPTLARLSPDGRWLAYSERVSNRSQVFIQGYPEAGARRQISVDGGLRPNWSRDGKELFFRSGDRMFGVSIDTTSGLQWGQLKLLFQYGLMGRLGDYDVAPDGRFLLIKSAAAEDAVRPLNVIVNWRNELVSQVPVPR